MIKGHAGKNGNGVIIQRQTEGRVRNTINSVQLQHLMGVLKLLLYLHLVYETKGYG